MAHRKDLANREAMYIHGLQPQLRKWVANNLHEPITKLFNLVAKEGFPSSSTVNIIQMIFNLVKDAPQGTIGS